MQIYFVSDFHLGVDAQLTSRERERKILRWLDVIAADATELYLVGDVFDFWFEYKSVVPKGHVRLLGKLAELVDGGLPIHFFTGNHDMWIFRYFEDELGIPTHRQPIQKEWNGRRFFIGHGDGLGPGDHGYKFLKKVLANPTCQWLYERFHPNFGLWLMRQSSGGSRAATNPAEAHFMGAEKEWLVQFCEAQLKTEHIDYFIFGHRHLPIDYKLSNGKSRYVNLGEWMNHCSFAAFDGEGVKLKFFENENGKIYGKG